MQLDSRIQVHLDFSLSIDDPPAEVPGQLQHLGWVLFINKLLGVASQELKNGMCVRSIDVDLVREWERHTVLFSHRALDLLVGVRLLV